MSVRQFYVEQRKNEHQKFKNVLNALPQDKFHYKPHDRSPSTTQIVWTMTLEMKALIDMIDSPYSQNEALRSQIYERGL